MCECSGHLLAFHPGDPMPPAFNERKGALTTTVPSSYYRDVAKHVHQGWTQGRVEDDGGNLCLMGALYKASNTPFDRNIVESSVMVAAVEHLSEMLGFERPPFSEYAPEQASIMQIHAASSALISWNDQHHRTKRDVIELLMIAADQAEVAEKAAKVAELAKTQLEPWEMARILNELKVEIEALDSDLVGSSA